jgi:hypothetical protein
MCPLGITFSTECPQFPTARYTPDTGHIWPVVLLIVDSPFTRLQRGLHYNK